MGLFGMRLSRRPIHGQAKLVQMLLVILIIMLTLFGLFANRFSLSGRQRFVFSKKYLAYSIFVTLLFSFIYLREIYLETDYDYRDAVKLYTYMNITVAIINFVTQMFMSNQVARMMSKVPLFETLKQLHIERAAIKRSVILALIKVIGFPLVMELALMWQQKRNEPHLSLVWTLYKLLPMIISNFLNNCYFGAMIIAKNIIETINAKLRTQVQQVNFMQQAQELENRSRYYRIQQFCNFADELDNLAFIYKIVCSQATDYMALMSLSVVLSLICHLLGITVGVFNQYYAIAQTIFEHKPYDGFGALINIVFLIISLLEIMMLALLSNNILLTTQTTGSVLQELKLLEADWRYRQSVHTFSLQVVIINYRIKPMGLFEIDIALMNSVLSTVASFALILVQSDLSQRFK
ncbi:putative gustatory receptor 94a [Drosophila busckii]|uniref:putative gustatory receptor 94a n=1 Tax=Drosophila busckii TaxID=30019 RepID=UPI00083F2C76|nr:putative gustatory receptor 94a [Drosophila busckii]